MSIANRPQIVQHIERETILSDPIQFRRMDSETHIQVVVPLKYNWKKSAPVHVNMCVLDVKKNVPTPGFACVLWVTDEVEKVRAPAPIRHRARGTVHLPDRVSISRLHVTHMREQARVEIARPKHCDRNIVSITYHTWMTR